MRYAPISVVLGIILLTSSFGFSGANAATSTSLSLDRLTINLSQQGDTLVFTGRLIKGTTLTGVANATINIIQDISYNNYALLVSGKTDSEGYYSIPWVVDVNKIAPATGGSFGTTQTQGARVFEIQVKVFAKYDGDEQYASTVSAEQSFKVRFNQIRIFVDRKPLYLASESFTVGVRFTDVDTKPIDPDTVTSFFDNKPITLVRNDMGKYSFEITSLAPGQHSLKVTATKTGFITADQLVTIEGTKRKTGLVINTDKTTYQEGDTITVNVNIQDTSIGEIVTGKPVAASLTSPNLKVTSLTFVAGKATYTFTKFDVVGTWSITASFAGDNSYFGSSNSATFMVEKGTGGGGTVTPPTPKVEEKVSLGAVSLVDSTGSRLRSVSVGQQVLIQAKMTSNFATDEEIAYISQVKDADGVTLALSWITSTVSPGQTLELAVSWLAEKPGEYTAEVFVWKSVTTPEPLSLEIKRSTIIVK